MLICLYSHGTGHGVGHYLNVHEGTIGFCNLTSLTEYIFVGPQGIGIKIGD